MHLHDGGRRRVADDGELELLADTRHGRASSRRGGPRSGRRRAGASRVARSVKSVWLTQPAVRSTSPCQLPYERCLLSTTAAGWRSTVANRGAAPTSSAHRRQSGRNHDSRGSLMTTWSASRNCASSHVAQLLPRTARRAPTFAVSAQAAGRASATCTPARSSSRCGSRRPTATRRSRAGSSRRPAPPAGGRGTRAAARIPANRLVPLRPEPATRTSVRSSVASVGTESRLGTGGSLPTARAGPYGTGGADGLRPCRRLILSDRARGECDRERRDERVACRVAQGAELPFARPRAAAAPSSSRTSASSSCRCRRRAARPSSGCSPSSPASRPRRSRSRRCPRSRRRSPCTT